ncbi:hypothetical protein LguiA_018765 [Lonicera macranthoides]
MIWRYFLVLLLIHSSLAQPGKGPVESIKPPEPNGPVEPINPPEPKGPEEPIKPPKPKAASPPIKWPTLSGAEPLVVARGGASGMFPESSNLAYQYALATSLPSVAIFCDLQLTKDEIGICLSSLKLENATDIKLKIPDGEKTYDVNGEEIHGWFTLDYPVQQLISNVTLMQDIFTRTSLYDGLYAITTPDDVKRTVPDNPLWLNVEYDMFYNQHKLSAARYIQDSAQYWTPQYISSPEIGFLRAMDRKVDKKKTKLIFKFNKKDMVEPTTKETYGDILGKLPTIKSFASGILVHKDYIWQVSPNNYLTSPTTLVADAHREGLEVFVFGLQNDGYMSYNCSYDPIKEYLNFVGSSDFAVDGVLTEFPSTASEAIECFAHKKPIERILPALVISHNGASGDYPGSTDLAYQKAMDMGTDIIDCSVQMSKDGVPFCMGDADLTKGTNAFKSFMDQSKTIPELQSKSGIFSFDLTWSEIKTLRPKTEVQGAQGERQRNPLFKDKGNLLTLAEFLELAKTKESVGIMVVVQKAAYLASKQGLGVVDAVTDALNNSTFNKKTTRTVMIVSDDTSVLARFKDVPNYKRILSITHDISDAPKGMVDEVKKHADGVLVSKESVLVPNQAFFIVNSTKLVEEMHAANLSVYVGILKNEFVTLAFDYISDPYVQLATVFGDQKVDGVVTDFPATAVAFLTSECSNPDHFLMGSIIPGDLFKLGGTKILPPPLAPAPALGLGDIVDPPLPPVAAKSNMSSSNSSSSTTHTADAPSKDSSNAPTAANVVGLSIISCLLLSFLCIRY